MAPKTFADQFEPRRQLDNTTVSVRTINGRLHLVLTLEDGRHGSRPISKEIAEAYWSRGRHFAIQDALADIRAEIGQ